MDDVKRVLVVDDELLILRIISDILTKEGYEVKTAINYQNAVNLIGEETFSVVLTDIRMPEKSGIDLLGHIRQINKDIPVVLMTGFASLDTAVEAVKQGAFDYLTKPLDFNKLKRIINQSIEKFELLKSNEKLVTELQEVNTSLESKVTERTRELENILNSANESIVTTDSDLIIKTVNPKTKEIYDRDCLGQKLSELIPGINFKNIIPKILSDPDYITKHEIKYADKYLEISLSQLTDFHSNEAFGIIAITDDITDKKKLEVQLLQSAKMSAVGQLAAGVAHEFNNVLSGIVGYTSLALSRNDINKMREDLKVVDKASNRAIEVVRKLLAFSRQKDEKYTLGSIDEIIEDTISLILNTLEKEGIKIVKHFGKTPPIKLNQSEIQQVLLNLILNAKHAITSNKDLNESNKIIGITTSTTDDGFVKIDVSDTGVGIPRENIPRIFEPFFTTKDKNSPTPGTGLGLPITYAIIERHGGTIDVNSKIGEGTTFTIWFRYQEPFSRDTGAISKKDKKTPDAIDSARKASVLVVDDDEYVRNVIKDSLTGHGHHVVTVENAKEGVELIKNAYFDVAFIDYVLPDFSGLQVVREIKSNNIGTMIIIISGSENIKGAEQAMAEGANSFLQKPFKVEEIYKIVSSAMGH